MITVGIDCGYRTGGVALLGDDWVELHDLPVYDEGGVDVIALMDIIKSVDVDHIFLERQQAMPKQGVVSMFKLGYAYGQIMSTCALSGSAYTVVTPMQWKKSLNLSRDKDASRRLAQQWHPSVATQLTKKKDEHKAEALLIATYGRGK